MIKCKAKADVQEMIIGFKDENKLLYHYTKMCVAKDHILKSGTLLLGSFGNMNDPKESKIWEFNLGTNQNRDLGRYNQFELSKRLSDALKNNAWLVCFCRDSGPLTGNHLQDIAKRGYAKPRMWAQYAEKHTGVCLVFDRELLGKQIERSCSHTFAIYAGNVTYRDRLVVPNLHEGDYFINVDYLEEFGFEEYVRAHLRTYHRRLFFEKMQDWRDEKEFRWVVFSDTSGQIRVNIADSLVGVIFGDSANEQEVEEIIQILLPTKVQMMGIRWHNCSPWYDYASLKYDRNARNSPWFRKNPESDNEGKRP